MFVVNDYIQRKNNPTDVTFDPKRVHFLILDIYQNTYVKDNEGWSYRLEIINSMSSKTKGTLSFAVAHKMYFKAH